MKKESITNIFFSGMLIRRTIGAWLLAAYAVLIFNEKDFTSKNFLQENNLFIYLIVFLVFFFALSSLSYAVASFKTDSLSMLVGALLLSLTWIIKLKGINEKNWLFCFTMIAATALILLDFISQNHEFLNHFQLQEKTAIFVLILCGVICTGVIAVATCFRYINFAAPTFDFGIFVQMFHNMSKTLIPETTCERNELLSHFAVHLSPICYILLPFYWLFPSPLTLQIGQAVVVASGIVPFYLIMRHHGFSFRSRIGFSVVYMLFPIISRGCFYDFHENCFLLPLLLSASPVLLPQPALPASSESLMSPALAGGVLTTSTMQCLYTVEIPIIKLGAFSFLQCFAVWSKRMLPCMLLSSLCTASCPAKPKRKSCAELDCFSLLFFISFLQHGISIHLEKGL